ncbi:hypothetical protein ANANG_G00276610 [Anguilla anguilla]|uniref:Uncharacterized protein n=1 Tax=Anguilla anguilla TaxID=7936 RepID=A0A9D3RKB3_ANGAN|nr:hypothetical protein ANANG_G00276610 [Anguilla anguilla]
MGGGRGVDPDGRGHGAGSVAGVVRGGPHLRHLGRGVGGNMADVLLQPRPSHRRAGGHVLPGHRLPGPLRPRGDPRGPGADGGGAGGGDWRERQRHIRPALRVLRPAGAAGPDGLRAGGALQLLAGACALVPLSWNLNSVVANRTISFPPRFNVPPAPVSQEVGAGIAVGITAAILVTASGLAFLSYRFPFTVSPRKDRGGFETSSIGMSFSQQSVSVGDEGSYHGRDNQAFQSQESI